MAIVNEEHGPPLLALVRIRSASRSDRGSDRVRRSTTIVGVAGNVRPVALRDVTPQIYVSYLQQSEPNITLLVRSAPGLTVSPESVKQAIWSVVPEQPLFDIRPMAEATERSMAEPRLITRLLGGLAVLALLMSTLGVYTVVSYLTARRTKEVALRRAIGADALDVLQLLAIPTLSWTLAGLTIGIVVGRCGGRCAAIGCAQDDGAGRADGRGDRTGATS